MKAIKPVNYIIITDGIPSKPPSLFKTLLDLIYSVFDVIADDPESVIVQAARRLDAGNFPLTQVSLSLYSIQLTC